MVPRELDIYVAGFPCKDFSMLNKFRPCMSGPNASIFGGVVRYIQVNQPRTYVLENVPGIAMRRQGMEAPIHMVMRMLRDIPDYRVAVFRVNTNNYYLPQHRARVYIIGVHTKSVRLRLPMKRWDEALKCLARRPSFAAHDFLLSDDAPEILELRRRLAANSASKRGRWRRLWDPARAYHKIRHAAPVNRKLRWWDRHRVQRMKLGLADSSMPFTSTARGWSGFLNPRMRDCLEMQAATITRQEDCLPEQTEYIGEISRGIGYMAKRIRHSPCVTPNCRMWFFNRWRWAVGIEKLALQGFPVDELDLGDLSEVEIEALAGNSMSVPVVGAMLLLVLAFVQFPDNPPATWSPPSAVSC